MIFSANGTGMTGYPHGNFKTNPDSYHIQKNEPREGLRHKCKSCKYETSRRNTGENLSDLRLAQVFLNKTLKSTNYKRNT